MKLLDFAWQCMSSQIGARPTEESHICGADGIINASLDLSIDGFGKYVPRKGVKQRSSSTAI